MLGLCCCVCCGLSLDAVSGQLLFIAAHGLLIVKASLVAEHRLSSYDMQA